MQGYRISDLDSKTQELIKKEKIDQNNDGLINKDNGELAHLLSRTDRSDIQQLAPQDQKLQGLLCFEGLGLMGNIGSCMYVNSKLKKLNVEQQKENPIKIYRNIEDAMKKQNPIIDKTTKTTKIPLPKDSKSIVGQFYRNARWFNHFKGLKGLPAAAVIGLSVLFSPTVWIFPTAATMLAIDPNKKCEVKLSEN